MTIVRALQFFAGLFLVGALLLVVTKGQQMLILAVVGTSHAALLWAAAAGVTYLSRMSALLEWTALKGSRLDEHDRPSGS